MAKRTYVVPFHTHTTDLFKVEATSPAEAAMLATERRMNGDEPDHRHVASFKIGTVKSALADPVHDASPI